jgi:hypothetical protein
VLSFEDTDVSMPTVVFDWNVERLFGSVLESTANDVVLPLDAFMFLLFKSPVALRVAGTTE